MKSFLRFPLLAAALVIPLGVGLHGLIGGWPVTSSRVMMPGNPRFATGRAPLEVAIESVNQQTFGTTLYPDLPIFPMHPSLPAALCRQREFTQTVCLGKVTAYVDFHT